MNSKISMGKDCSAHSRFIYTFLIVGVLILTSCDSGADNPLDSMTQTEEITNGGTAGSDDLGGSDGSGGDEDSGGSGEAGDPDGSGDSGGDGDGDAAGNSGTTDGTGESGSGSADDSDNSDRSDKAIPDSSSFVVFNETRFRDNPPDMTQFGLAPLGVAYTSTIYGKSPKEINHAELPPSNLVIERTREMEVINSEIAVIDIEHWPTAGDEQTVREGITKYSMVYDMFKQAAPGLKFGYYDMVPIRLSSDNPKPALLRQWRANNDLLKPFVDKVDALFPSAYTRWVNKEAWRRSFEINITEARRISQGKPVYVFLWPQYPNKVYGTDKDLHYQYLDGDYWRFQLETAREYADGVVIWFPYKTTWAEASQKPWWKVTQDFLREI